MSSLLIGMATDGKAIRPPVHDDLSQQNGGAATRPSAVDLYVTKTFATFDVQFPRAIPNWELVPGGSKGLYQRERQSRHEMRQRIKERLRGKHRRVHNRLRSGGDRYRPDDE